MARSRPLVVERVARLTAAGSAPLGATGRLSVAGFGLGLVLFACAAPKVEQPDALDTALPVVDARLPYADAIVVEVDADRRAQLFAPGETEPRATADLADRREQSRLGRALAALCADPSLPIRTGLPAGIPTEVAPHAHSNPYVVRIDPETRFAAVQHLMAQGADPDSALWNFVLEVDGRAYELPLPVEVPDRLAELFGVAVNLRRDGADGALRIGVGEARKRFTIEVEEESEDVEAARAEVRWVDLDGFEAIVREGVAAGHTAIELDPRAGTTVADVTPLLDIIERVGGGRLQVSLSGSYE